MVNAKEIVKKVKDGSSGQLTILDKVNLSVADNEFVAICGASGCGKSTLLSIIAGIDKPDSGSIIINDTDIYSLKDSDLAHFRNENIGMVFQKYNLISSLSVIENVEVPQYLAKRGKRSKEKAKELLALVGLKDCIHHKVSGLSGGEQQRVAIARALIQEPSILLADEPTGNLDSANSKLVVDMFKKIKSEIGLTILMVTHDEKVAQSADRIFRLAR